MTRDEYTQFCRERLAPKNPVNHIVHGIIGEFLELMDLIDEKGEVLDRACFVEEAGDVLFYLTLLQDYVEYDFNSPEPCPLETFVDHTKRVLYYESLSFNRNLLAGFHLNFMALVLSQNLSIDRIRIENVKKLSRRYESSFTVSESIERKDTNNS